MKIRVRPYTYTRRAPLTIQRGEFAPSVLRVAIDEAESIMKTQDHVVGYQTEAQARQVQDGLVGRGIVTEVYADIGPMVNSPRNETEARVYREIGVAPGTRYVLWGVRRPKDEDDSDR